MSVTADRSKPKCPGCSKYELRRRLPLRDRTDQVQLHHQHLAPSDPQRKQHPHDPPIHRLDDTVSGEIDETPFPRPLGARAIPGKLLLCDHDLDRIDRVAIRRFYRILRIRIPYAPPGSPDLDGSRHTGCSYGLDRDDARDRLVSIARDLSWFSYLGSK